MKKYQRPRGFSTEAIHAGYDPDPQTGAVNVPIYALSLIHISEPTRPY